ncbi:ras-associated and pleckstrin homology domains-containing protein 1-like [Centruroides vittatus]|uniref:ras-associated and pleckstrin homology domains-containing protein 1-like n=1 Tax=Centruroides vittatus TaxID=120091 RepID=UPI00350F025C
MEKTTFIVVAAAILLLATIVQAEEKKEQVSNESNKEEKSLQAEASSKEDVRDPLESQATSLRNTKETLRASETSDPPHPAPEPYQFSFETKDPKAGEQFRKEDGNKDGVVRGSYGFRTPNGIFRVVDYIADSLGFRAKIRSNEPGISNRHPTGVKVEAEGGGELIGSGRPPPPPPSVIDEGERVPVAIKSFGQRVPAPLPPVIEDEKVAIGVKDFDQRVPAPISPVIDGGEKVAISGFGHRVPPPPPQAPVQVTYFNKPPPPPVSGEVSTGVDYEEPYDSPRDFKKPDGFDSEGLPPPPPPPPRSPPSTLVVKDYSPPPPPPPSKVYIQEKVPVRDADIPSPPVKSLVHYNVWFNKYAPPLGSYVDREKYSPPPPSPPSDDYVEDHAAIKVQPPSGDYEEHKKYVPPPPPPPPPPSQDYEGDDLVIKSHHSGTMIMIKEKNYHHHHHHLLLHLQVNRISRKLFSTRKWFHLLKII